MSLSYHLIDGYNLLHAAGLARERYGPRDLERARFALLLRIADGLDESERMRTVVVFDAADPPPDVDCQFHYHELTIEFAPDGGDADAHIEALIRRHSSPRQLRVVSDDNRVRQAAKRRGAQAVKSEAFLNRLARQARSSDSSIGVGPLHPKPRENDTDPDDWKAYFGLTDAELTAPPKQIAAGDPDTAGAPSVHAAIRKTSAAKNAPPPVKAAHAQYLSPDQDADDNGLADDAKFWQARIDQMLNESPPKTKPPHDRR